MISTPPPGYRRRGSCATVRLELHHLIHCCLEAGAATGGTLPDGRRYPNHLERLAQAELAAIAAIEDLANLDPEPIG